MKILKSMFTLIILSMALNVFAQTRFTQKEKDEFIQELKQEIKEYKEETKKPFKAEALREELFNGIAELRTENSITYHEERKIIERYNDLVEQVKKNKNIDEEKAVFEIIDQELKIMQNKVLQCVKEGNVCNDQGCCDGLSCAIEPKKSQDNKCAPSGNTCNVDGDCCSGECELSPGSKQKFCREIKRCYRPQAVGARCNDNPVCAQGSCLPFDSSTSGYAIGLGNNAKCKQDKECRSNFCQAGVCSEQRVCKECVKTGNKVERGLKCCEGLMPNSSGRCIPDAPPIVLPQVNNLKKSKHIFVSFINFLLKESRADADSGALSSLQQMADKEEDDKDKNMANQLAADSKMKSYSDPLKKQHINAKYQNYTKSDFSTCMVDFKSDYYNYMMSKSVGESNPDAISGASMFDYNSALLAFEFMSLGQENYDDFWLSSKDSSGASIHKRLKNVSLMSQKSRNNVEGRLIEYNRKLTCLCLDTMGPKGIGFEKEISAIAKYKAELKDGKSPSLPALSQPVLKILCGGKSTDKELCKNYQLENKEVAKFKEYKESLVKGRDKVTYYADYCEEEREAYATLISEIDAGAGFENVADDGGGDASGIKGTRMLVYWTKTLQDFTMELSVDNTDLFGKFVEVHGWYNKQTTEDLWSQARIDKKNLFNFDVEDNRNHRVYSMAAALIAATLTIGAMTIIGGASIVSVITTWTSLGIITAASIAGGGGGYIVASLRGAWIGKTPFIEDQKVRTYNCGSKKKPKNCTIYTRSIKYPYSEICNAHVSSNACVKHFLVTKDDKGNDVYIVDPWIPVGMKKSELIRDDKTLVSRINDSFAGGVSTLATRVPDGRQTEEYRVTPFLTSSYTGYFAPKFLPNYVETYTVTPPIKELIKKKAKEYAIAQNFFDKSEAEQLESFAEYAYEFHFVWAKSSASDVIAYPQPAFLTYLDMMSAGVAGKLAVGNASNSNALRNLNAKYISTYKKMLSTFRDKAVTGDRSKMIEWTNKELSAINAMENQNMLIDKALAGGTGVSGSGIGANTFQGASVGGSGDSSGLSGNAAAFVSSVKKLRSAREDQLKKLNEFKKNVGDSERGKALLASQSSTLAKFSSPSKSGLGSTGRSLFNSGSAASSGSGSESNSQTGTGSGSGYNQGNLNNVGAQSFDGASAYGSYSSSGSSRSSKSGTGTEDGAASAVGAEDAKRIEGALDAMDKNGGKDNYQSNDEDNLWERITKTYIRNYDKVLIKRKKDKDLPINKD